MEPKLRKMHINKAKTSRKTNVFPIIYLCSFMNFYAPCLSSNLFTCACALKCRSLFQLRVVMQTARIV